MPFSDRFIRELTPKPMPYRAWERGAEHGFHVQVSPTGGKTFCLFYRFGGRRRFFNLGRYPQTSLATARKRARLARELVDKGIDPQHQRRLEAVRQRQLDPEHARWENLHKGSVQQLFENYCQSLEADSKRSSSEVRRALERNALPVLGATTKAKDVSSTGINEVLDKVVERGALVQANRLRAYLSAAFQFGIAHDRAPENADAGMLFFLDFNPVRDVPKPQVQERTATHSLNGAEISELWHGLAVGRIATPTRIAIKLMLATAGQQLGDTLAATWPNIDVGRKIWEIDTTDGIHVVPLGAIAIGLLEELREHTGGSERLFPKQGGRQEPMPSTTLSRALSRYCEQSGFPKTTPRDLRRTCRAQMTDIGIGRELRDRLHNLRTDEPGGFTDPYADLHEKITAMRTWDRYLKEVLTGTTRGRLETVSDIYTIPGAS
ncbi:MAG: tyrosine-type recombinase/integrase [Gammaproteobacteria bacterium]